MLGRETKTEADNVNKRRKMPKRIAVRIFSSDDIIEELIESNEL